jgi:periplasmic divalent cation tolerance protein
MSPSERTPEPVQVVLVTAPDREAAVRIAHALVEERLAACVNLVPAVHSVYRWKDAVEEDDEVLLLVKTCHGRTAALAERIRALHPYELPEVLALEASGGSAAYLDWVRGATSAVEERS